MTTQDTTLASVPYAFNTDTNNIALTVKPAFLPIASSTALGAIKVGTNLSIAADGTLSASGGGSATITSPNNTLTVGGTASNPTLDVALAAETIRIDAEIATKVGSIAPRTWTQRTSPFGSNIQAIQYDSVNNQLVLMDAGGRVATTTDGITFTSQTRIDVTGLFYRLVIGSVSGTQYYIVVSNSGRLYRSTDLITWTVQAFTPLESLTSCAYGNSTFVALQISLSAQIGPTVWRSTDALTWQSASLTAAGQTDLTAACFGNGVWVIGDTQGRIYSSPDLINFTLRITLTVAASIRGIAYGVIGGQGRFVAVSNTSITLTSTDGTTWTQAPTSPANFYYLDVEFVGDRFLAAGGHNTPGLTYAVGSTVDGVNWTHTDLGTTGLLEEIGEIPQVAVVVGSTLGVLLSSVPNDFVFQTQPATAIVDLVAETNFTRLACTTLNLGSASATNASIISNGTSNLVLGNSAAYSGLQIAGGQATTAAINTVGLNTNINLNISPKGTGNLTLGSAAYTALAVVGGQASNLQLQAVGVSANIDLVLTPKGTGNFYPIGRSLSVLVANQPKIAVASAVNSTTLGVGTAGQVLTSNGTSGAPYWAPIGVAVTIVTYSSALSGAQVLPITSQVNTLGLTIGTSTIGGFVTGGVYKVELHNVLTQTSGTISVFNSFFALATAGQITTVVPYGSGVVISNIKPNTNPPNGDYLTSSGFGFMTGTGNLNMTAYVQGITGVAVSYNGIAIITRIS